MATKTFAYYPYLEGTGAVNNATDTFKMAIVTEDYSTIDAIATDPTLTTFTEVAQGGNYTAGGVSVTPSYTYSAGTTKLDFTDVSIAKGAGSPVNGKTGVIINVTAGNKAVQAVDLNSGVAVDLVNDDLNVTISNTGAYAITVS